MAAPGGQAPAPPPPRWFPAEPRRRRTISTVQDADDKDCYERLLMGLRPKAVPVILVRAIIDRDFVPNRLLPDEVVELD